MKFRECYHCSNRLYPVDRVIELNDEFYCDIECVIARIGAEETRLRECDCDQEDEDHFPEDDEE